MFNLIETAKDLGSFSLANTAFAILLDKALDSDVFQLFWDKSSGDDDDIYFDLLVVSDGLREACIPAPLLKDPLKWRQISVERDRRNHDRKRVAKHWSVPVLEARLNELATKIVVQASNWKPEGSPATSRHASSAAELYSKYVMPHPNRYLGAAFRDLERVKYLGLDIGLPEAMSMQFYIDCEDNRLRNLGA